MNVCLNCVFFTTKKEVGPGGWCHRYPPQLVCEVGTNALMNQTSQFFPWMEDHEWCGEWKQRP